MKTTISLGLMALLTAGVTGTASACASCGCALSADAATGYSSESGWSLSLQYDYINQSQLRYGRSAVSPSQAAAINDAGGSQEVENNTSNRYVTLGLAYAPNADWNVRALLPYVARSHSTYGASGNPLTPDQLSAASVSSWGDAKLLVSYQGWLPTHNLGVQLGVKLPTGHYGGPDASGTGSVGKQPAPLSSGPNAGQTLDTSLQAGTGSTDLIVGAYYFQPISQDFDGFINGQFQAAVHQRLDQAGADFRPGNALNVNVGVRYMADPRYIPQLQLNVAHRGHDQGVLADTANSGGTVVYLSPGLTVNVLKNTQIYGFVQLPVYSRLDGFQLLPRWSASVGMSYAF